MGAQGYQLTVGHDHLHPHDGIPGCAVLYGPNPAGVVGYFTPNGRNPGGGRCWRIKDPILLKGHIEVIIHNPWLHPAVYIG